MKIPEESPLAIPPELPIDNSWQIAAEKAAEAMREIDSGLLYKEPELKLQPQEHAVENPPTQASGASSTQTQGASSPATGESQAPTMPTAPTAADAATNPQPETPAGQSQTAELPKPQENAVENPPTQASGASSTQTQGASSPATEEPTAPTIPTAPTAADAAANPQTETPAAPPQTAEPPKQPKDPEAVAKSAIGDTAAQVKSVTDIIGKDMTVQSLKYEQQYKGAYKLAALFENGMMMFQDGTAPARFTENPGEYLTDPEEINKEVQRFRQEGDALKQKYGDFHGKAYLAGMLGKIAGGVGHVVDFHELGKRAGTAYDSGKDSDWDAVAGQLAKMATNVAGGVASLGVARVAGLILAGWGAPAAIVVGGTILAGAVVTYVISEIGNYMDREISNGKNPFDFSGTGAASTEAVIVGDVDFSKYGDETLIKADNLTLIGNQRFKNLEIQSKSLDLIGNLHSDEKMIINSDEIKQSRLEDLTQEAEKPHSDNQTGQAEVQDEGQVQPEAAENPAESHEATASDVLEPAPKFDIDAALRVQEGQASRADIENMERYAEWLNKQQAVYSTPADLQPVIPEMSSNGMIQ